MQHSQRLKETAALDAVTYEQHIQMYKGSPESIALAMRFCREFEPDLLKMGFRYKPNSLSIAKAAWVCDNKHRIQDVISLFNKSGITFIQESEDNGMYVYCAKAQANIPRFGGLTTIYVMAYPDDIAGIAASFSFFGQ